MAEPERELQFLVCVLVPFIVICIHDYVTLRTQLYKTTELLQYLEGKLVYCRDHSALNI
jgi:hypothetical protein